MPCVGVEPSTDSSKKTLVFNRGGAKSGALAASDAETAADLRAVVEAWPTLSNALRAGIVAIVRSAGEGEE